MTIGQPRCSRRWTVGDPITTTEFRAPDYGSLPSPAYERTRSIRCELEPNHLGVCMAMGTDGKFYTRPNRRDL